MRSETPFRYPIGPIMPKPKESGLRIFAVSPIFLTLAMLACAPPPPECGDGTLDIELGEACDDGVDNGDAPGACRLDCTLPICGDGVVDSPEESCDDANDVGGDGCTPDCVAEEGVLEAEPNDLPVQANSSAALVHGSAMDGDRDCWAVEVEQGGYVRADAVPSPECPGVQLELFSPSGDLVATGAAGTEGCHPLDPIRQPNARFVDAGRWAVCASGLLDRDVPSYALEIETGQGCDLEGVPWRKEDDPDGDGQPNECDDDDDGDGINDEDDNCPLVPNSGDPILLYPGPGGWLQSWLAVGPLEGIRSTDRCMPTPDRLTPNDANAMIEAGISVEGKAWAPWFTDSDRLALGAEFGGSQPREIYLALWVRSPSGPIDATVALGPDDGVRAWLDDSVILEDPRCQGTSQDKNVVPVALTGEWQRLLVKVYDQGGGWGLFARFKDADNVAPLTDLEISLQSDGPWAPDQTDSDGDGLGDVCDPTPRGG